MSLNIKNPTTTALVRELAERSGVSMTRAVELAVRSQLSHLAAEQEIHAQNAEAMRTESLELLQQIRFGLSEADRQALRQAEGELFDEYGRMSAVRANDSRQLTLPPRS